MMNSFNEINNINVLTGVHNVIRQVNPVTKKVFNNVRSDNKICGNTCYTFWKGKAPCSNCIAMRALNENKTQTKIEYNGNKLYMVTAYPMEIGSDKYVMELFKDITDTGMLEIFGGTGKEKIKETMQCINESFVKEADLGIYNKRYVAERLPYDLYKKKSGEKDLTTLMIKVNLSDFENEEEEKEAVEYVLFCAASELTKHIDNNLEWVARYDYDKLMVVLYEGDNKRVDGITERLRNCKEFMEREFSDLAEKVTLCVEKYSLN